MIGRSFETSFFDLFGVDNGVFTLSGGGVFSFCIGVPKPRYFDGVAFLYIGEP
jgi:hypothetical protein